MPRKPTYEEIKRRLEELDKKAINCKRTEETLPESEKRFKNVTNSIEELLVFVDLTFKVQAINTTLAKAYNVSLDEYAGKYCYELFYGRTDICEGCPAIKVLNEGKVIRDVLRYRPDGRIINRTAYPFIEDNGDITGVIVIGSDITQQKQADEKLRESEELLRAIVESTADGILVVNEKGQVVCTNERFAQLWRIPDELIKKRQDNILLDCVLDQLKEPKAFLSKVQALYKTSDEDFDVIDFKDGRVFERFSSPLIRDGQIAGRVWSFRDITERKIAEEENTKLQSQLQQVQKMESMGTLAGGIAHDFNNILAAIMGYTELTLATLDNRTAAEKNLAQVLKAASRAKDLVQQILTFSHHSDQERKPVRMDVILQDTLKLLRATLPSTIAIDTAVATRPLLLADATQLQQVLMNLSTNAAYAMRERGGRLTIRLRETVLTRQDTEADLGTTEILENADLPAELGRHHPNRADGLSVAVVIPVGEVEPGHVHAGLDQPRDAVGRAGRRSQGTDDLGLSHAATSR